MRASFSDRNAPVTLPELAASCCSAALWAAHSSHAVVRARLRAGVADRVAGFRGSGLPARHGAGPAFRCRGAAMSATTRCSALQLGAALPALCLGRAASMAATMAVLNATSPLFGVLIGWLAFGQRPTLKTALGLGWASPAFPPWLAPRHLATGTCRPSRRTGGLSAMHWPALHAPRERNLPPFANACGSMLASDSLVGCHCCRCCCCPLAAPLSPPGQQFSGAFSAMATALPVPALGAAVALGLLCTGLAYLLYFRLIADVGAVSALPVTYLIPAFGIGWECCCSAKALPPAPGWDWFRFSPAWRWSPAWLTVCCGRCALGRAMNDDNAAYATVAGSDPLSRQRRPPAGRRTGRPPSAAAFHAAVVLRVGRHFAKTILQVVTRDHAAACSPESHDLLTTAIDAGLSGPGRLRPAAGPATPSPRRSGGAAPA